MYSYTCQKSVYFMWLSTFKIQHLRVHLLHKLRLKQAHTHLATLEVKYDLSQALIVILNTSTSKIHLDLACISLFLGAHNTRNR